MYKNKVVCLGLRVCNFNAIPQPLGSGGSKWAYSICMKTKVGVEPSGVSCLTRQPLWSRGPSVILEDNS